MMLDANAKVLTLTDHPEVMSILPNITGQNVLELGAGIGYTDDAKGYCNNFASP